MIRQRQIETSAADFIPQDRSIDGLRLAARTCRDCELHREATQTVFGEGPSDARAVFVGDQPGGEDDREGRPFAGPAGKLLDAVLQEVGIDRRQIYLTNVVKHFKSGRREREHRAAKATSREIHAWIPWLEAELEAIRPEVVICLGAMAAQSLLGPTFRVSRQHGQIRPTAWAPWTIATFHPAAILHCPDAIRADIQQAFVADMKLVAERMRTIEFTHHDPGDESSRGA
ncbi:MAG TPA: UdgX family uracil-DNA binding protein [Pirellulales bacterium]|jgi:DNA polymerase|nr:UdgX family uracil-DNA binding protein [Pirellulales bacterium]